MRDRGMGREREQLGKATAKETQTAEDTRQEHDRENLREDGVSSK